MRLASDADAGILAFHEWIQQQVVTETWEQLSLAIPRNSPE